MLPSMEFLIREIRAALNARLEILALHGAMSIPDICSALETNNPTVRIGDRYSAWFDRWLGGLYSGTLTGQDVWWLRCKMQHQGAIHDPRHSARIVFTANFHRCVAANTGGQSGKDVSLVPGAFCEELLKAADQWLAANSTDVDVQRRMQDLMRFYPHGVNAGFRMPTLG